MKKKISIVLANLALIGLWLSAHNMTSKSVDINMTVDSNVSKESVEELKDALNIVPNKTLQSLSEQDWKITLLDDFSDVSGYEHIDNDSSVVGFINFDTKTITIKGKPEYTGTVKNVTVHELCHYIDQNADWLSNTEEFLDLYEKYKDGKYRSYYYADITLTDRYAEDVLYATSTEKEFFAETLKDYYMHKQYLSENYRDIYAYFAAKGL